MATASRFRIRALVGPLGVASGVVLLVSGLVCAANNLALRQLGEPERVAKDLLRQDARWVAATVLATVVAIAVVYLLMATAATLPHPWRRALSVAGCLLSPLLSMAITVFVVDGFTIPPGTEPTAVWRTPGWLTMWLPTAATVAAIPAFVRALRRPDAPA